MTSSTSLKTISYVFFLLLLAAAGYWGCENGNWKNTVIEYNGRPTPDNIIQVYAHRAITGLLPEQTLPGYTAALKIGCDYVDMDVAMTDDNVLVVTHDLELNPDITRDADGNWITERKPIYDMTYAELKTYNVGKIKPGTRYAELFPHQTSLDFAYIPTLEEVIHYVKRIAGRRVGFQIEIKNDPSKPELSPTPEELSASLYTVLKKENILNRSEIQAFDWRCLIEMNRIDPDVKTAYLTDRTTISLTDNETGLWTAGLLPKDFDYSIPKMIHSLGGYCWEPFAEDLTLQALEEARQFGLKVVPWEWPVMQGSEFNYETVERLIRWGVDGIISDRADILRGILTAKGFNVPRGFYIPD